MGDFDEEGYRHNPERLEYSKMLRKKYEAMGLTWRKMNGVIARKLRKRYGY